MLCFSNVANHYDALGFGFEAREHAVEMYDMVRLMGFMSTAAKLGMYNSGDIDDGGATRRRYAAALEVFQAGIKLSKELSLRHSFKISDVLPQGLERRGLAGATKTAFSETDAVNKSTGLMSMFFEMFAVDFKQPAGSALEGRPLCKESRGAENCVFADTPLFASREDLSGTFMGQHLRVGSAGELITIPRSV